MPCITTIIAVFCDHFYIICTVQLLNKLYSSSTTDQAKEPEIQSEKTHTHTHTHSAQLLFNSMLKTRPLSSSVLWTRKRAEREQVLTGSYTFSCQVLIHLIDSSTLCVC